MDINKGEQKQVSSSANFTFSGLWRQNNELIIFRSSEEIAYRDVYLVNVDTNDEIYMTTIRSDAKPALSPDGNKIAFLSVEDSDLFEIYAINLDGTQRRRLTGNWALDYAPAWQP